MLDRTQYPFCSEFYIVEKSIEVVVRIAGESCRIRIDALHRPGATNPPPYTTAAYIEEDITVQPASGSGHLQTKTVWVDYDLPSTARDSADDAIAQALSFLHARCLGSP